MVLILILGGAGALGKSLISYFKVFDWWIASIDYKESEGADFDIVIEPNGNVVEIEKHIFGKMLTYPLENKTFDAIINAAGGWISGNALDLVKKYELMMRKNVDSAVIATSVALKYLKDDGFLIFLGAQAALDSTAHMIAYCMAKNSLQYLTKCLSQQGGGFPKETKIICVLPEILDTQFNRESMPNADDANWTPLDHLAKLFASWIRREDSTPRSGQFYTVKTKNKVTSLSTIGAEVGFVKEIT